MTGAYIRGVGLSCALGEDAESCVSAMQRMQIQPIQLRLDDFSEPLKMPYYRIPDHSELFDAERFERLLPPVTLAAVTQAGLTTSEIRRLPVFVGSSCFSISLSELHYAAALARQPETAIPMPSCGYQDIADILQRTLGCRGNTYTYNTACTSSANALLAALRMIKLGWYQHALVVGVELANRTTLAGFSGLQLVAKTLLPFGATRKGLLMGEGIGAIVLSADSDPTNRLRVICGASNCDTWSLTTANTNGNSIAKVLNQTLRLTQVQPHQIYGIKAHGTGTSTGDAAEALGLRQIFQSMPPISALKPYLGHTLGACCVNELILYASALLRGFIPAVPKLETPDPALGIYPLQTPDVAPDGHYLLNHFGFGGNNTVLALEKIAP